MKIVITEKQYRLILEENDYTDQIVNLLTSEDSSNNELGFHLMKYNKVPIKSVIDGIINNFFITYEEIHELKNEIFDLENESSINIKKLKNDLIDFEIYIVYIDGVYTFIWEVYNNRGSSIIYRWINTKLLVDDINKAINIINNSFNTEVKRYISTYINKKLKNI